MTPKYKPALTKALLVGQGKSRDTYATSRPDALAIYASNRISTHNIVHESEIERKGEVLTALTIFWLKNVLKDMPHHLLAHGEEVFDYLPGKAKDYPEDAYLRTIIVKRLKIIPVEFIFRNYNAGSLHRDYVSKGIQNPYGIEIASGTKLMHKFEGPIFTPTQKSEHDEPMMTSNVLANHTFAFNLTLEAFNRCSEYLASAGITMVDSKFEVGEDEGGFKIADEIATPDSSRFCETRKIREGEEPPWLDKQIARDYAEFVWKGGPKRPLKFPRELCRQLTETYVNLFPKIAEYTLGAYQQLVLGS